MFDQGVHKPGQIFYVSLIIFWACSCNTPASDIACNCCNGSCNCCNLPGASSALCIRMPQCLDPKKHGPCLCQIREIRGMAASQQTYTIAAPSYCIAQRREAATSNETSSHHIMSYHVTQSSCHVKLWLQMLSCPRRGVACVAWLLQNNDNLPQSHGNARGLSKFGSDKVDLKATSLLINLIAF